MKGKYIEKIKVQVVGLTQNPSFQTVEEVGLNLAKTTNLANKYCKCFIINQFSFLNNFAFVSSSYCHTICEYALSQRSSLSHKTSMIATYNRNLYNNVAEIIHEHKRTITSRCMYIHEYASHLRQGLVGLLWTRPSVQKCKQYLDGEELVYE